jgi:GPH family glycoside/pentoside/hexuronide:cation symporter
MNPMSTVHKIPFVEKLGYTAADAAANFVFMTMILFQLNFYTDTFGLTATAAAAILFWPRIWDAIFDPIMGVIADRTKTRWGKFRPWIIWTAVPWAVVMVLAYTTPKGWSMAWMIAYAAITNTLMMTIYSMNNMPYAALGGVITGDLDERAKLNSYRFVAVNVAQFIVGGFTLPLVAKFAQGHDLAYGWRMTMTIWAVLCLVLFFITFVTTRERITPIVETNPSARRDVKDLLKNGPWVVMFIMTLILFAMMSFRGGTLYNYYHHYADKGAMFDFLSQLGLTAPPLEPNEPGPGGVLESLGYIVHGTRDQLASSNVAKVFYSVLNIAQRTATIIAILLSVSLAHRFGKKAVAVTCFGLQAADALVFYLLKPTDVYGMVILSILNAIVAAPAIPLIWSIFADVADYSEWKTGRRFTGLVFATIGFALKAGLAIGSVAFLWIMAGFFDYNTKLPAAPEAVAGYRFCAGLGVGIAFATCTVLLSCYKLNKRMTIEMAAELAERRKAAALKKTQAASV